MEINSAGKYRVKGKTGRPFIIDVVERDGQLGVCLKILGEFVPVDDFDGSVQVLERLYENERV